VVFVKAPMRYQVVAAFFQGNICELNQVRMELSNDSLQILGRGENAVINLKLTINHPDLTYKAEAWYAYRGLFSAQGYFSSTTFKSRLKGKGIIYFPLAI